ncbi:MAG: cation diffusion facilitator family transporter [Alphaproteobacteria bacterium]|nr:cation diffusion facilitator family transporter [Alphaproteobacteria bacterium]MDP6814480.1 cation diffusion facilitator family transporter [Alphaproteobacteria bacterium]
MSHGHQGHGHDHGHDHGPPVDAKNERRVLWALLLTGGYMLVEVAGGLLAGSLTLLADAGHMLTDAAALALAWMAFRVARRPNDARRTYGYHRVQVLAAFVNGVTLVVIVVWIAVEAVRRLLEPVEVLAGPMLAVAVVGLAVNITAFLILRGGKDNLNVQGAALHVLGDLLGSVAAIVAALVIMATGWSPIDPLLSLLVALLVLRSAWQLTRRSAHILLEGAPEWLDEAALKAELIAAVPQVRSVHHVHVWMLTQERPLMTLHAEIDGTADHQAALLAINQFLKENYAIDHATIQIETAGCVAGDEVQEAAGTG